MIPRRLPLAPLGFEALEVCHQLLPAINVQGGKRAAAEVVDENVLRHQGLEAGLPDAYPQVVVVEEAQAELLIEAADLVQHLAPGQQAEARQPLHLQTLAGEL